MDMPIHAAAAAVHAIEREATTAWQHLEHHHTQPPAPATQEDSMAATLHAAMYDEIDAIFDDAKTRAQAMLSRYLADPHNLLGAVADFIDAHSGAADADANPAA